MFWDAFAEFLFRIWEHLGKPTSMVVADLDNMTSRLATAEDSEQAAGEEKLDGRRPMGTDISSSASYVTIILFRTVIKMQFTTQVCLTWILKSRTKFALRPD